MRSQKVRDSYLGCLAGMAAGDALGAGFDGIHRYELESSVGLVRQMSDAASRNWPEGKGSTEIAQAIATLESVVTCKEFDGEDIVLRLVALLDEADCRYDSQTRRVLERVAEDPERWQTAPLEAWYRSSATFATNGALTRAPIVALRHGDDLNRMIHETVKVTRVTHVDPRCVEAAIAINFLITQCLHGAGRTDLLSRAALFIDSLREDPEFVELAMTFDKNVLDTLNNPTPLPSYLEDRDSVSLALRHIETMSSDELPSSPFVVHSIQTAIWCFFNAESFEEGVSQAVSIGGSTDVQGALAGALLGARFGLQRIPVSWLKNLEQRPKITSLAELLFSQVQDTLV